MHVLLTRHSAEFNPIDSPLDPEKSPYTEGYEDYPAKRHLLGKSVGTDSFLWCISAERQFRYYEFEKPVEWKIRVADDRVLGYVNNDRWMQFLGGKTSSLDGVFSATDQPEGEHSVLVVHPLYCKEIMGRRQFHILNCNEADVLREEFY